MINTFYNSEAHGLIFQSCPLTERSVNLTFQVNQGDDGNNLVSITDQAPFIDDPVPL